jgi:hypothetical protein
VGTVPALTAEDDARLAREQATTLPRVEAASTTDEHDVKAAEMVECTRCHGRGTYSPHCFRCDDSGDDHECPDERPCKCEPVADKRATLAAELRATAERADAAGYARGEVEGFRAGVDRGVQEGPRPIGWLVEQAAKAVPRG